VKENSLVLEAEAALNIQWPHLALKLYLSIKITQTKNYSLIHKNKKKNNNIL